MITPLHSDAVVFDEMECCAMQRASTQEIHQSLIKEYMASDKNDGRIYKELLLLGVFRYTVRLVFIPAAIHRSLYSGLALAEKALLEKPENEMLECGHLATQHCDALQGVRVKMMRSTECK